MDKMCKSGVFSVDVTAHNSQVLNLFYNFVHSQNQNTKLFNFIFAKLAQLFTLIFVGFNWDNFSFYTSSTAPTITTNIIYRNKSIKKED